MKKMAPHLKFAALTFVTLLSLCCLEVSAMDGCNITRESNGDKEWGRRFWKCGDQCLGNWNDFVDGDRISIITIPVQVI